MVVNRPIVRERMREIHDVLVDHDHRDGPEDGCVCAQLREEMRQLYLILNPHPRSYEPRAGPMPSTLGGRDDPLGEVEKSD